MESHLICCYPLSTPKSDVYQLIYSRVAIKTLYSKKAAQLKGGALVIYVFMKYTCVPHLSAGIYEPIL